MRKKNLEQVIVQTAYRLFEEKGFENVSVMDICDACDITKPTFYKHVNSKEDLLSYFFQTMTSKIPEDWYKYSDETNFWEKIRTGFCFFLEHVLSIGIDMYTATFIANLRSYKGTFEDIPSFKAEMLDLIRMGQETGQILNESSPEELYACGVALSIGYGGYWCFLNDPDHDLILDFVNGLRNSFMVDLNYTDPRFYRQPAKERP